VGAWFARLATGRKHPNSVTAMSSPSLFDRASKAVARLSGKPSATLLSVVIVGVWLLTGPMFGYSDTWQLVINTGTTIVTFVMVFLIQNTQNRDTAAMHIKLDEIIRAVEGAHNALLGLEDVGEEELAELRARYRTIAEQARKNVELGKPDVGCPEPTDMNCLTAPDPASPARIKAV
jgi:low affinity Fe/Cu permease